MMFSATTLSTGAWLPVLLATLLLGATAASSVVRLARPIAAMTLALGLVPALGLLVSVVTAGPVRYVMGGWAAPLGIELLADGLSACVVLTTLVIMLASMAAPTKSRPDAGFWVLWLWLAVGLVVLFTTADLFNAYVALELIGISAAALVAMAGGREALLAGTRYLLVGLTASAFYLLGVALVYHLSGALSLDALSRLEPDGIGAGVALGLITAGALMKAAAFPLHGWLPPAHANAPPPGSAVLSALVVKAGVVVTWRAWGSVPGELIGMLAPELFGVLGIGAIVWGAIQAARAERLKTLLAYSTVAQVGYLVLVLAMLADGMPALGHGAVLLMNHAFAKAAAFCVAGHVLLRLGSDQLGDLRGLAATMPLSTMALAVAFVALVGLPPGGSFVAKWELLVLTIEDGRWVWALAMIVGTLMSALYLLRPLSMAFEGVNEHPARAEPEGGVPRVALALGLVTVLLFAMSGAVSTLVAGQVAA